jgi:hypothetical protein
VCVEHRSVAVSAHHHRQQLVPSSFRYSPHHFCLVAPDFLLISSRDHHNQPHDPAIAADDHAEAAAVAVTSPRFTLDEAHKAAAVHDLLVYVLVGGEVGWKWDGLSKTTMRTSVEGNVEQLMGLENGKGKVGRLVIRIR